MSDAVEPNVGRVRLTQDEINDFGIPATHVTADYGLVFMESDVERIVTQRVRDALVAAGVPAVDAGDTLLDGGADGGSSVVAATGNGMKSHDRYDTFLDVSGGDGNRDEGPEVHLRIRSNDGHNEGQAWFPATEVLAAIQRATTPAPAPPARPRPRLLSSLRTEE